MINQILKGLISKDNFWRHTKILKEGTQNLSMKRVSVAVVIAGLIIVLVGFIPLTRTVTVTEEKVKEVVEYREETKYREETRTKEEPYTEEITVDETKEEVIFRESVKVRKSKTYNKEFELATGDVIIFKFNSEDDVFVTFMGPGVVYITSGKNYEEKITVREGGVFTLTYSAPSDTTCDFDIYKTYTVSVVKTVEKTRTVTYTEEVPYTENVPYTVSVPYTEETTKEETYTLDYLKYAGSGLIIVGLALYILTRMQKRK